MSLEKFEVNLSKNMVILLNIVGVLYAIILNTLAVILPLNNRSTREISDSLPNLFAPASYVFSIWSIIYIGWILMAIAPFINKELGDKITEKTNIWLFVNLFFNGTWIITWHYGVELSYLFSVILMIIILLSLIILYSRFEIGERKFSSQEIIFIQFPISIYFGWITVATIANITAYLVSIGINFDTQIESIITIVILLVGIAISGTLIYQKKDFLFSFVIIWAYLGIFIKQIDVVNEVAFSALFLTIFIVALEIYLYLKKK